jgi:ADP-ribosyl-[dinitrogen reductase] hydrolase
MWTDDTQLMIAIGKSLVSKKDIDYDDIAQNHIIAFNERRGWGKATKFSVQRMISGVPWWNAGEVLAAGNGPVMKIAPIGVLSGLGSIDNFELNTVVNNISRMTHGDPRAMVAAITQCHLIDTAMRHGWVGLQIDISKMHNNIARLEKAFGYTDSQTLWEVFLKAFVMAYDKASDDEIRAEIGTGPFVLESFPFTCAMIYKHGHNIECCLENTINQGGDADTTGAMAGMILGAAHGYSKFPLRWRRGLEKRRKLLYMADRILKIYG